MDTIVQWNCRGLRANVDEIHILIKDFIPVAFCLQETLFGDKNIIEFRRYTLFCSKPVMRDGRAHGGAALMIRKNVPHSQIDIVSNLQAVAARVSLFRPITICSIYLPPSSPINIKDLEDLLAQLPSPVLLVGDLNAHSPLWGSNNLDNKGKQIEDFINNNNLCLLNTKTPTYIHPATGSQTAIDLSICDPSIMMDFSWAVHDDLCGSDHFPLILQNNKPTSSTSTQRWKLNKADWSTFVDLCETRLTEDEFENANDPIELLTTKLLTIATQTIPRSKTNTQHVSKPWFNEACKDAITERKNALRIFDSQPNSCNLENYKMCRARTRRTIREAKRYSWQTYVSKLNCRTPLQKAWDMIRKISGKTTSTEIKHLNKNNKLITDINDITNTLAESFSLNSSTEQYTAQFQQFKKTKEKLPITFK
jgi:exonuclease III